MNVLAVSVWRIFTTPLHKIEFKICYNAMMQQD